MVDVFISYSRANRETVSRLAEAIGRLGYVVWWDEELPAHLSYGDVITAKIHEAKATLVVWSADSTASEWVRAEADLARNRKTLIQASIDGGTPPLPFNQIQYAAIGDWTGAEEHKGWRKICASLAALCGPAPVAEPLAIPAPPAPEPAAVVAMPAPVAAPRAVPRRIAHPARKNRANRVAFVAIAASVMTILTVGGLVLLKGPPVAIARPVAAAPALAVEPAQTAAPAPRPPKAVIDVGVRDSGEAVAPDEAQGDETAE